MPISADRVIVELEAKLGRYTANVTNAERHFDRSMKSIQGSATRTEARVASAFRSMSAAAGITIGTAGVVLAAREFLRYADATKNVEAQLRLATRESGTFAQATEDVRRIAAETRSGLEETANLYAVFQRNSRELGISQEQAARATETVTKAFQISGASAAEAAGGLRQFLQGIQSGTLRGEELNSVLENAPRLAKLIAESLGVTIGELRKMGQEGELAGAKLIAALTDRKFTAGIDEEFRELPVTFDQAMTLVNNAAIQTFGAFDRGGEFSTALANFITDGTEGFTTLEGAAEEMGIEIRSVLAGLHDAFEPMLNGALDAFGVIGENARSLSAQIAQLLGSLDQIANFGAGALDRAAEGARTLAVGVTGNPFLPPATPMGRSNMRGRFQAGAEASRRQLERKRLDRQISEIMGSTRGLFEPGGEWGPAQRPARPSGAAGSGKKKKGPRGPSAETLARRAEAARVAEERRQQAFDNELAALNADFLAARRAITVAAEALAQMERDEIEIERVKYNDNLASQVSTKKLTEAEAERLRILNDQIAVERTRAVDLAETERQRAAANDIASADLKNEVDLLQISGQLADTNSERRDIALRLLDLTMQIERLELEGVIASRDATEAQKEIARRRLAILGQIEAGERANIERDTEGPLDRYRREAGRTADQINEDMERVAVSGLDRLNEGLVDAIMGTKSLGDVFKQVANQIIADLLRIAIQSAIMEGLSAAFGGGGGGGFMPGAKSQGGGWLGTIFGAGMSLFGGGSNVYGSNPSGGALGMARGGSFVIAGRGGSDQNLMSINGRAVARVSKGERVTVTPQGKALRGVSGAAASSRPQLTVISAPQFDLRGMIGTARLMQEIERVSRENAAAAAAAMGQGVLKAVPARMAGFNNLGT